MSNKYVIESDIAIAKYSNGALFAPTGVGKGVSISNLSKNVLMPHAKNQIKIFVIIAHRILLAQQLSQRCVLAMLDVGQKSIPARISIHSGHPSEYGIDDVLEKMILRQSPDTSPRSDDDLETALTTAIRLNQNILINVTYHSLDRLNKVLRKLGLDTECSTFDEIHHIFGRNVWKDSVEDLISISHRYYGFTATPGKNRKKLKKLFGSVIYEMDIRTAIDNGLITKPRWFITSIAGDRKRHISRAVTRSFTEFQKRSKISAKMLVHCKDSTDLTTLSDQKTGRQLWDLKKKYSDLMIAEVSSARGHLIDGALIKDRLVWLNTIKKHNGRLIVLHIDICNSGIDVPGFNFGLWTYVPGSEVYTTQGNGRSGRLDDIDREMLMSGIISPANLGDWNKPYNTIGIIDWVDSDDTDDLVNLIKRSREHGFDPEDTVYAPDRTSINRKDPFEGQHGQKNPIPQSSLAVLIQISVEEEERKAYLSFIKNDLNGRVGRLIALVNSH